jgi:hypothetical protein
MCMACNKVSECAYNAGKGYDDSSKRIRGDRAKWCHGDSLCEVCDVPSSAYCPAGRTPSRTPNDCKLGAGTCLHWRPGCDKNDDGLCDDYCGAGCNDGCINFVPAPMPPALNKAPVVVANPPPPPHPPPPPSPPPPDMTGLYVGIGGGAVVAILLIVGGLFVIRKMMTRKPGVMPAQIDPKQAAMASSPPVMMAQPSAPVMMAQPSAPVMMAQPVPVAQTAYQPVEIMQPVEVAQPTVPDPVTQAPTFCKECGSPLKAGAKFCGSCGATVAQTL